VLLIVVALAAAGLAASQSLAGQAAPPDVTFPDGPSGQVVFGHATHVEKGSKCTDCHTKIFKMTKGQRSKLTMKAMQEGKECGVCHNGTKAFDVKPADSCAKCHKKS
jgi:c(7)-type cytochrome triheme protein